MSPLLLVGVQEAACTGMAARPRVDLNGTWEFRLDPDELCTAERWGEADGAYPDEIVVPGNWQAQGYGPPRGHLRHDYQSVAWYRREVRVPNAWQGRRVWLHLGGVTNTADVYVNGQPAGHIPGFLTPYEFDITDKVAPGDIAVVACRVDSRGPGPVGMFNHVGRWGGLYRGVFLEARPDPAIEDVFVIPDVPKSTARVQVTVGRANASSEWQGTLSAGVRPTTGDAVSRGSGPVEFAPGQSESDPVTIEIPIGNVRTWSPGTPNLYSVVVSLARDGRNIDTVRDRFGMRQFGSGEGGQLLLNGRPYFVRGIGDDSVEVLTGTPIPGKDIYVERFRMAKRYGFNGCRFLSHTPIDEAFEAADEVGFLIMCEGEVYVRDKSAIPLLKQQVPRIVKA